MYKNVKLISVVFLVVIGILTGCSNDSVPYKKGETYKEGNDKFLEVVEDNGWKVKELKGKKSDEASYKVESTEYKHEGYAVVSVSLKEKNSSNDPLGVRNDYEYHLLSRTKNGFSSLVVGTSHPNDTQWNKFKKGFENASDKEEFLKQKMDDSKWKLNKFEKVN